MDVSWTHRPPRRIDTLATHCVCARPLSEPHPVTCYSIAVSLRLMPGGERLCCAGGTASSCQPAFESLSGCLLSSGRGPAPLPHGRRCRGARGYLYC